MDRRFSLLMHALILRFQFGCIERISERSNMHALISVIYVFDLFIIFPQIMAVFNMCKSSLGFTLFEKTT